MIDPTPLTPRQRFLNCMEYRPVDRVPNHELGVWPQTRDRWEQEGLNRYLLHWDWFEGEEYFDMDPREFIDVRYDMRPPFAEVVLERTDRYEIIQHANGIVTKALLEGTVDGVRLSMDQYLRFPRHESGRLARPQAPLRSSSAVALPAAVARRARTRLAHSRARPRPRP